MPAASEAVGAPGGGEDVEREEYEIRNDEGFVYRVRVGLHHDDAPSTTQSAAGPDPKAAALRRRRRALLCLRDRRLRDLSRWEALASVLRDPHPAPQPPASLPASSHPVPAVASSSASSSLDELLARLDSQMEFMKKAQQLCDKVNTFCDAYEAEMVDSIVRLPFWGSNPRELMYAMCRPDGGTAAPDNLGEQNEGQETSAVSSATAGMIKNSGDKQTMGRDVTPILTESRMRKRVTNLSNSNNVASKALVQSKRKKASGTASMQTPGSRTRKAEFLETPCSKTTRKPESGTAPLQTPGSKTRKKAEPPEAPRSKIRRKPASATAPMQTPGSRTRRKAEFPEETPRSKIRRKLASEPSMFCTPVQLTRRKAAEGNL